MIQDLDELEQLAGKTVYNEAVKLFHRNAVIEYDVNDLHVSGKVRDEALVYDVMFLQESPISYECSCHLAQGYCVHVIALAIQLYFESTSADHNDRPILDRVFDSLHLYGKSVPFGAKLSDYRLVIDWQKEAVYLGLTDQTFKRAIFNKSSLLSLIGNATDVLSMLFSLTASHDATGYHLFLPRQKLDAFFSFCMTHQIVPLTTDFLPIVIASDPISLGIVFDPVLKNVGAHFLYQDESLDVLEGNPLESASSVWLCSHNQIFHFPKNLLALRRLVEELAFIEQEPLLLSGIAALHSFHPVQNFETYLREQSLKIMLYKPVITIDCDEKRTVILTLFPNPIFSLEQMIKSDPITTDALGDRFIRNLFIERELIKKVKEVLPSFLSDSFQARIPEDHEKYRLFTQIIPLLQAAAMTIQYAPQLFQNLNYRTLDRFQVSIGSAQSTNWFEVTFNTSVAGIPVENLLSWANSLVQNQPVMDQEGRHVLLTPEQVHFIRQLRTVIPVSDMDTQIPTYQLFALEELCRDSRVDYQLSKSLEDLRAKLMTVTELSENNIPEINGTLREYQRHGVSWLVYLYQVGLGGILADDMGLGKTIQVLTFLKYLYFNEKSTLPTLIIVPTSTVYNWQAEAARFTPELKTVVYMGTNRKDILANISQYHIVLTTYAIIRRSDEAIGVQSFLYTILDEAQYIKNDFTQTAELIKQIPSRHRLALTGTPLENHLLNMWSIFDFLMPGFLGNKTVFQKRFGANVGEEVQAGTRYQSLRDRIRPFVLRRMKGDVLRELPPKEVHIQWVELTDEQKILYKQTVELVKSQIATLVNQQGFAKSQIHILTALLKLRQIACHPNLLSGYQSTNEEPSGKFQFLKTFVKEVIQENHKILLFSQFTSMLKIIRQWCDQERIRYCYLDGTQPTSVRQKNIHEFNDDGKIPLFLISLRAGGMGINLTAADYVIHYDPWWNPAVEEQAIDRAHRIGQNKKVFVYKFITKNTVEEKIYQLQKAKIDLFNQVVNETASSAVLLTPDLVNRLLSFDDLDN